MDNTIFAQSVARIRSLETKMLDDSKVQSLVEARDFEDCIRLLQDSRYSGYVTLSSYEDGLKSVLEDLYADMYKTSPIREVVDILSARYDAHNIKSLIKGRLTGTDVSYLLINAGTIPALKLADMVKEENLGDMPKTLKSCVEKVLEGYKEIQDPQDIDISVDKAVFAYMQEIGQRSGMEFLEAIVKLMIDMANIKAFIRCKLQDKGREFLKRAYIPGGRLDFDVFGSNLNDSLENFPGKVYHTDYFKWVKAGIDGYMKNGDLGVIEKSGDNYIIDYLWKAKLISFGPEPLVAFMLASENEIKILRIILTGKSNRVNPESIRERLRDVYV